MLLVASDAPRNRPLAHLLTLRVPGERGTLALNPDFAAELAAQLPHWADDPYAAVVAGQAITLFLQPADLS